MCPLALVYWPYTRPRPWAETEPPDCHPFTSARGAFVANNGQCPHSRAFGDSWKRWLPDALYEQRGGGAPPRGGGGGAHPKTDSEMVF